MPEERAVRGPEAGMRPADPFRRSLGLGDEQRGGEGVQFDGNGRDPNSLLWVKEEAIRGSTGRGDMI